MERQSAIFYFLSFLMMSTWGHEGHDHGHEQADTIPETDKSWSDPSIHSLAFSGVTLKWKMDSNDPKYAVMKMSGRTSGYVSVGFCPVWGGGMTKCDIVLGWVDSTGPHVHDYYAPANTFPELDSRQDCQLVSGTESNGITSIVFRRKWDTGDDDRDANLDHNDSVHVIYAWNDHDPINPNNFEKHEGYARGHTMKAVSIKGHQHGLGSTTTASLSLLLASVLLVFGAYAV